MQFLKTFLNNGIIIHVGTIEDLKAKLPYVAKENNNFYKETNS